MASEAEDYRFESFQNAAMSWIEMIFPGEGSNVRHTSRHLRSQRWLESGWHIKDFDKLELEDGNPKERRILA